jgi:AraC-like DNA-binding protein
MGSNDTGQKSYEQALFQFCKGYVYIIVAYILSQVLLVEPSFRDSTFVLVICNLLIIQIIAIITIHVIPFRYLTPASVIYNHINTIAVCVAVILLKTSVIAPLLWVCIIILSVYIIHPWKRAVFWYIYVTVLIVLTFAILNLMAGWSFVTIIDDIIDAPLRVGIKYLFGLNVITFALLIIFHFLYFLNKIQKTRAQILPDTSVEKEQKEASVAVTKHTQHDENSEKYRKLYVQIETYYDNVKPFVKSNFTINQLAVALKTNTTYIYKAININCGVSFNTFTNQYRIKKVKAMLLDNSPKYTLAYIAFLCGFSNYSTFNKAFKEIEGITPSTYCKNLNKEIT